MNSIEAKATFVEISPGILGWKEDRYTGKSKGKLERRAGDIAGSYNRKKNRWYIAVNGKPTSRARIMWMFHNGDIPEAMEIDHKNLDRMDDRIENLRLATRNDNQHNKSMYKVNKSGYKGVFLKKGTTKWAAQIRVNTKVKFLGYYHTPEEAYAAYCKASRIFHGDFSNVG